MKTYNPEILANPRPLDTLHQQFVREKQFLGNAKPKTLIWYWQSWNAFRRRIPGDDASEPDHLNREVLKDFVIRSREAGLSIVTLDTYIRGVNSYLTWLHNNEHTVSHLKMRRMKMEKRLMNVFTREEVEKICRYKPMNMTFARIHALALTILDTGVRISEAFSLKPADVDFDRHEMKVMGKGSKERRIPFSQELEKILSRYRRKFAPKSAEFFFCNRDGGRLIYSNMRDDYLIMLDRIGVPRKGSFHRLRHTFGTHFIRNGGSQFSLQKILGHEDITTTAIYVHPDIEALRADQEKTSLLKKRKK